MRVQVLVVVETGRDGNGPEQAIRVQEALRALDPILDNTGIVGKIDFVAAPLNARQLCARMMADIIEEDGQKPEYAGYQEPYRLAGDKLLDEALDLVP